MSSAAFSPPESPVSRRCGIALRVAVGLGLGAVLTPLTGAAAEPEPTVVAAPAETEQLAALKPRLQTLLGQLQPYDIPQLAGIAAEPAPATLADLTQRVDRVYVATATETARRIAAYDNNLRAQTDERVRLEAARVDFPKLEQELAAAPNKLKAEEARTADLIAQAARAERIATALRENTAALEENFLEARGAAIGAVYYLLPASQRVAFYNETQKNSNHPAYAHLPEVESDRVAKAAASAKPAAPATTAASPAPPAPVAGTLEEKFAAFEDKQRALRNLSALLPPQEKQLAAARELAEAQVAKNDELNAKLAEFTAPLAKHAAEASEAEDRILTAQVNQKIAAGNLLRLGTSAILWSYLREHIVAPQLERFLEDNRLAKGRKGLVLLEAINQKPQDFVPRGGTFANPGPLGSLRIKLLDIEPSLDVWAGVATDALVAGKISAGPALTARFFKDLDKTGVEILNASLDTLDAPQKKIATALLARAPAE